MLTQAVPEVPISLQIKPEFRTCSQQVQILGVNISGSDLSKLEINYPVDLFKIGNIHGYQCRSDLPGEQCYAYVIVNTRICRVKPA